VTTTFSPLRAAALAAAFAAIAYYDAACARCHGPQGSFYGAELGKHLTDAQLVKVINDMAEGPGAAPLTAAGLAAETAFHRAIIAGTPFLSVTKLDGATIAGEVTPDAAVSLSAGGKAITATVDGSTWQASLPPGTRPDALTLTAEREGKKTTLPLSTGNRFSHSAPLPATQPAPK
jgi:hypothetical protein